MTTNRKRQPGPYKQIGARLRYARKLAGYETGFEYIKDINMQNATLWSHEMGHKLPSTDMLIRISQKLCVSIDWILFGKGDPPQDKRVFSDEN